MIDIHTHILPKVDDGASSIEVSLNMLRQAMEDGIKTIVLTPHILNNTDFENENEYYRQFEKLQIAVAENNIKINLLLGSELYIQPEMALDHKMATLNNNGVYFLVEFPMGSIPRFVAEMFFTIITNGMIPIIAHPERNIGFLKRPELAYEFIARGALMQVNAGSLWGQFGSQVKSLALNLLEHNLVHFIASDCHDALNRRCRLRKAYDIVTEKWGRELADDLFENNAKKILMGKKITPPEPIPISNKPKTLLEKIKSLLT